MTPRRLLPLLLLAAGCEQIIGADFSKPTEISSSASSGDGSNNQSQPAFASADEFCNAFASALCQADQVSTCWDSQQTCLSAVAQACTSRMGTNAGYKGEDAKDCVDRTKTAFSGLKLDGNYSRRNSCLKAFGRFAKAGEDCASNDDCTDPPDSDALRCLVTGPGARQCVPRPANGWGEPRQESQPCASKTCDNAHYCDASAATPACKSRVKTAGDPCPAPDACYYDGSPPLVCVEGTCRPFIQPDLYFGSQADKNVCSVEQECNTSFCVQLECQSGSCTDGKCSDDSPCGRLGCQQSLLFHNTSDAACTALKASPLMGTF